ncbi:MAG: hypothetical protein K2X73_00755 [Sphingomonas sp.]|nr:hypothetical protein [Sphingomonas sp.]MBX9880479.1 hypothetical protein [Sphingomonas sp.]
MKQNLDAIFEVAIKSAIQKIGVTAFKRTSFFASNEATRPSLAKAA